MCVAVCRVHPVTAARPRSATIAVSYFSSPCVKVGLPAQCVQWEDLNESWEVAWYEYGKLQARPFAVRKYGIQAAKQAALMFAIQQQEEGKLLLGATPDNNKQKYTFLNNSHVDIQPKVKVTMQPWIKPERPNNRYKQASTFKYLEHAGTAKPIASVTKRPASTRTAIQKVGLMNPLVLFRTKRLNHRTRRVRARSLRESPPKLPSGAECHHMGIMLGRRSACIHARSRLNGTSPPRFNARRTGGLPGCRGSVEPNGTLKNWTGSHSGSASQQVRPSRPIKPEVYWRHGPDVLSGPSVKANPWSSNSKLATATRSIFQDPERRGSRSKDAEVSDQGSNFGHEQKRRDDDARASYHRPLSSSVPGVHWDSQLSCWVSLYFDRGRPVSRSFQAGYHGPKHAQLLAEMRTINKMKPFCFAHIQPEETLDAPQENLENSQTSHLTPAADHSHTGGKSAVTCFSADHNVVNRNPQ
eukprot:GHVT01077734.1.p1 GENE.GHVT01077734.1~~GHVT01077734.1.p1  ORF type:complete len:470 (+),score=32.25 GHVT01077734.1:1072-2481(+)